MVWIIHSRELLFPFFGNRSACPGRDRQIIGTCEHAQRAALFVGQSNIRLLLCHISSLYCGIASIYTRPGEFVNPFTSGFFAVQNTSQFRVRDRDAAVAVRTAEDGQRTIHVHRDRLEFFSFPESASQAESPDRGGMVAVHKAPRGSVDSIIKIGLMFVFWFSHVSPIDKKSGCQTPARFFG